MSEHSYYDEVPEDPFTDEAEYRQTAEGLSPVTSPPVDSDDELLASMEALLLDSDGLDDIPDPEPLIHDDILNKDTLNWLVGKPGQGKSFVAIDQAGCVATGRDWQGHAVNQGRVLYLIAEGARGFKKRVRAWEKYHDQKMHSVDFLPRPVQATNARHWDTLIRLAEKRRYAMIILDTQARITVGIEENSNKEMGVFVHQAEKLREASGAGVVIVHHIGRNGDTGRGATTLDGALNTIMKASKDGSVIKLECQKNKDAEEWDDHELNLIPVGDSAVLRGTVKVSANLNAGATMAARQTAKKWWEMHADEWMSATRLIETLGVPSTTFYRQKQELRNAGVVEIREAGKGSQYRLPVDPNLPVE